MNKENQSKVAPLPDAPLHKGTIKYATLLKRLHDLCYVMVLKGKRHESNFNLITGGGDTADDKRSNHSRSQYL